MGNIKKWLVGLPGRVFDNAVTALLLSAAGAALLALQVGLGVPATAAIALVLFAAAGTAWNQFRQIIERHKRKREAVLGPGDMENRIKDWLYQANWTFRKESDPATDFKLAIYDHKGNLTFLFKAHGDPWITVAYGIVLTDEQREWLRRANPSIHHEMITALAVMGLNYKTEFEGGIPSRVEIRRELLFDGSLSNLAFLQTVQRVQQGGDVVAALVLRSIDRAVLGAGEPTPPVPDTEADDHPPAS